MAIGESAATQHVLRNLQAPIYHGNGGLKDRNAGATFDLSSVELYAEQAKRWLGDNSELSSRTIESADYKVALDHFREMTEWVERDSVVEGHQDSFTEGVNTVPATMILTADKKTLHVKEYPQECNKVKIASQRGFKGWTSPITAEDATNYAWCIHCKPHIEAAVNGVTLAGYDPEQPQGDELESEDDQSPGYDARGNSLADEESEAIDLEAVAKKYGVKDAEDALSNWNDIVDRQDEGTRAYGFWLAKVNAIKADLGY